MTTRPHTPPSRQRNALVPGVLTAAALLAGIPLIAGPWAIVICFVVAILALIMAWFAIQAKQWWWAAPMVIIAVLWNPVYPFGFIGPWWLSAHVAAAVVVVTAGTLISTPRESAGDPDGRR